MSTAPAAPARLLCDEPDLPGLLWAMRFDAAGRGRLVGEDEVLPEPGGFGEGFTWLHFNLNDARLATLVAEGRLGPRHLTAASFGSDPHQRLMVEDGHIGGVVADLVHGTGERAEPGEADAGGRLHFVMGPRLLASGRRHPVAGPDLARDATTEGRCILAPFQLLEIIVEQVVGAMARMGGRLADELDEIEDHILDERVRGERRRLGPIRRDAVRLHRQLLGLRAVFHRLETAAADEQVPAGEHRDAPRRRQDQLPVHLGDSHARSDRSKDRTKTVLSHRCCRERRAVEPEGRHARGDGRAHAALNRRSCEFRL